MKYIDKYINRMVARGHGNRNWSEISNFLQVCLFYCDETEDLARRIAAETDSIELSTIKWGCAFLHNLKQIHLHTRVLGFGFSPVGQVAENLGIIAVYGSYSPP